MLGTIGLAAAAVLRFSRSRLSQQVQSHDDESLEGGLGAMHCMSAAGPSQTCQDRNPLKSLRKGSLVAFRGSQTGRNNGHVAVVQPHGNGREYEVIASGTGVRTVPWFYDREDLYNISSECLFVVDRQGDAYAFHAVGANGAAVMAVKDANRGLVASHSSSSSTSTSSSSSRAKWWKLHGTRFINEQYRHKALGWEVHELFAIPVDALQAAAQQISDDRQLLRDALMTAEDKLERDRQQHVDAVRHASQQYTDQMTELRSQLQHAQQMQSHHERQAASSAQELEQLRRQMGSMSAAKARAEADAQAAEEQLDKVQRKYYDLEDQASSSKWEWTQQTETQLATLRQAKDSQLQLKDQQLAALRQQLEELRRGPDCKSGSASLGKDQSWAQEMVHQKDATIQKLQEQKDRLEFAFQEIMGKLEGLEARPTPVERASLDAVSVQELQAVVASMTTPDASRTLRTSMHLQRLLDQDGGHPGDMGRTRHLRASLTSPVAPSPTPGTASLRGLPQPHTQQPQQQQQQQQSQQPDQQSTSSSVSQLQPTSVAAQRVTAAGGVSGGAGPLSSSAGALPRGLGRGSAAAHRTAGLQGLSTVHTPSGLRDMSLLRLAGSNLASGSGSARSSISAEPQRAAAGGGAGAEAATTAAAAATVSGAAVGAGLDSSGRGLPGSPASLQALRERMTSRGGAPLLQAPAPGGLPSSAHSSKGSLRDSSGTHTTSGSADSSCGGERAGPVPGARSSNSSLAGAKQLRLSRAAAKEGLASISLSDAPSHRYSLSEGEGSEADPEGSCGEEELEEGGLEEHIAEDGLLPA